MPISGKEAVKKKEGDVGRAMVASEELGMVTRFRLAAFTIHASDEAAAGYSASEREITRDALRNVQKNLKRKEKMMKKGFLPDRRVYLVTTTSES